MKRYLLISVCLLALTNVSYGQRSFSSLSKLSAQTYKYWNMNVRKYPISKFDV